MLYRKKMAASATTPRKEKAPRKQRTKKEKHVDSDSDEDYASDVRKFQGWIQDDLGGGGGNLCQLSVVHVCHPPTNLLDYCKLLLDYCI
jgi:hypothetical protein